MKGDAAILSLLNEVLTGELTAVNQYWLHARMCQNWGYLKLWKKIRAESIDEMKHADELVERILYLEGLPNLQKLGKITVGETVPEQMSLDLAMEQSALTRLNDGIALCTSKADNGTRSLLERILVSEEEHVNWLETQLALIDSLGDKAYLAEQLEE